MYVDLLIRDLQALAEVVQQQVAAVYYDCQSHLDCNNLLHPQWQLFSQSCHHYGLAVLRARLCTLLAGALHVG